MTRSSQMGHKAEMSLNVDASNGGSADLDSGFSSSSSRDGSQGPRPSETRSWYSTPVVTLNDSWSGRKQNGIVVGGPFSGPYHNPSSLNVAHCDSEGGKGNIGRKSDKMHDKAVSTEGNRPGGDLHLQI